jgi:hypothetical protein
MSVAQRRRFHLIGFAAKQMGSNAPGVEIKAARVFLQVRTNRFDRRNLKPGQPALTRGRPALIRPLASLTRRGSAIKSTALTRNAGAFRKAVSGHVERLHVEIQDRFHFHALGMILFANLDDLPDGFGVEA